MSDKHTAAQGKTHVLKTDPAVFDAVARGDKTHEIRLNDRDFQVGDRLVLRETAATGADMRFSPKAYPLRYTGGTAERIVSHIQTGYGLADGWCILSFRATEGQAQTSGAVDDDELFEKWVRHHLAMPENFKFISTSDWAVAAREGWIGHKHTAQLADSTAPGAPTYDELAADLKTANATIRVMTEGRLLRDAHIAKLESAAPTAQQSLTAGGVDWLGLALDLEQQAKRVESQTAERAMSAAAHGLRLMGGGQSLTAGGAVKLLPECDVKELAVKHAYQSTFDVDYVFDAHGLDAFAMELMRKFAAAPLPQVQSEALDERARCVSIAQSLGWTVNGTWVITKSGDKLHSTDAMAFIRAADQQPVTPSGALADNDGGVA